MKRSILIVMLTLTATVLFAQGSGNTKSRPDTVRTVTTFVEPTRGGIVTDWTIKIIKDSIGFVQVDAETQKRQEFKDTTYYVPVPQEFTDPKTKKKSVRISFVPVNRKNIVHDFNFKL